LGERVSPCYVIQQLLIECRDVPDAARWPELDFLKANEPALHDVLVDDLSEAVDALANGQYKAATVVAFSVAEALINWLYQRVAQIPYTDDMRKQLLSLKDDLFVSQSTQKRDVGEEKLYETLLGAFDSRNLIHPDKAARTQTVCSRASAHVVLGAALALAQLMAQRNLPSASE